MKKGEETIKAWAIIEPSFEIPICDFPIKKRKYNLAVRPWAIFKTELDAKKFKVAAAKWFKDKDGSKYNLKVVSIEIKLNKS